MVSNSIQGDEFSSAKQSGQIFRANEYNPLRNPMHFSDARHWEGRGVNFTGPTAETREQGKNFLKSKLFREKFARTSTRETTKTHLNSM